MMMLLWEKLRNANKKHICFADKHTNGMCFVHSHDCRSYICRKWDGINVEITR